MIDPFAVHEPETVCEPIFGAQDLAARRPGVVAFGGAWMREHGGTDLGVARQCPPDGVPTSHHHESRAWDWGPSPGEDAAAWRARTLPLVERLTAPDADGNEAALARRLGLFAVIFDGQVWSSERRSWRPYTGADAHKTHVHFQFSWAGARGQTSGYEVGRPIAVPLALAALLTGAAAALARIA